MTTYIDEALVDQDFAALEALAAKAWTRRPQDVQALVERIRVELMIRKLDRRRRALYRAVTDYFEDIAEERLTQEEVDRHHMHERVVDYVRRLVKGLSLD